MLGYHHHRQWNFANAKSHVFGFWKIPENVKTRKKRKLP